MHYTCSKTQTTITWLVQLCPVTHCWMSCPGQATLLTTCWECCRTTLIAWKTWSKCAKLSFVWKRSRLRTCYAASYRGSLIDDTMSLLSQQSLHVFTLLTLLVDDDNDDDETTDILGILYLCLRHWSLNVVTFSTHTLGERVCCSKLVYQLTHYFVLLSNELKRMTRPSA